MGTTELEVQVSSPNRRFASTSDRTWAPGAGCGLVLAASASRLLGEVIGRTQELRGNAGIVCAGPLDDVPGDSPAHTSFGGPLLIESELARALGI